MAGKRGVQLGSASELTAMATIRGALAEFVALMIFNFIGCGAVVVTGWTRNQSGDVDYNGRVLCIAMAHGLTIGILVAATAGVSGGHINPAVTFGMLLTGRITLLKSVVYWVAQVVGAILGTGLLAAVAPNKAQGNLGSHLINVHIPAMNGTAVVVDMDAEQIQVGTSFLTEVIITFILVFVIWGTAVDPRGPSAIAPLMIGLTVLANHLAAIPITGASMNPARSFGAAVWSDVWEDHWIYWIGPLLGAAIAALFYEHVLLAPSSNTNTIQKSQPILEKIYSLKQVQMPTV
ncbi:hypothetical protein CBR_g19242 [Chara braunii]|uniref:Uncharacterized protein n=1 Tax=Chara braunii TaxID=69332 RepID=A0A388JTN2_CHABU|nr:hypothetical protein CBR_g19242 [Chara braunii]|eukprot:GBG61166.1 hypothetical protein CBR_g19242 [Chara braunii]